MTQCSESQKEAARLTPLLTPRTLTRLATWNIRTMYETGKTVQVARGERAGQEPVAKQILWGKWGWIGHTLRKPASSTTRQALTWNPQGKRKRGRPRNSWRRDTETDLKQQGTNWSGMTRGAQNRVQWRDVVDGLCSTGSDGHK